MIHQISISEDTMSLLKACAEPFLDKKPEDVIRRLAQERLNNMNKKLKSPQPYHGQSPKRPTRAPRERGTHIRINGCEIRAVSVRDLYEQSLKLLVDNYKKVLDQLIPYKTSSQRYLVANKQAHPSGNRFVVPVEYRGYYMEAHKDYKNGLAHLRSLAERLSLNFEQLS